MDVFEVPKFYGYFPVSFYCKMQFGCVFVQIAHFELVFWDFPARF